MTRPWIGPVLQSIRMAESAAGARSSLGCAGR